VPSQKQGASAKIGDRTAPANARINDNRFGRQVYRARFFLDRWIRCFECQRPWTVHPQRKLHGLCHQVRRGARSTARPFGGQEIFNAMRSRILKPTYQSQFGERPVLSPCPASHAHRAGWQNATAHGLCSAAVRVWRSNQAVHLRMRGFDAVIASVPPRSARRAAKHLGKNAETQGRPGFRPFGGNCAALRWSAFEVTSFLCVATRSIHRITAMRPHA